MLTTYALFFNSNRILFRSLAAKCDFENNRCGWKEASGDSDQFDWLRRKGSTPSIGTGPTIDHTTNSTNGYYLYIEATSGTAYQNAKLVSPLFRKVSRIIDHHHYHRDHHHHRDHHYHHRDYHYRDHHYHHRDHYYHYRDHHHHHRDHHHHHRDHHYHYRRGIISCVVIDTIIIIIIITLHSV